MIYGCSTTNSGKLESNVLAEKNNELCFSDTIDKVDSNSGCPGFLLHKELRDYQNHVLVIKADRSLFKKDTCYKITVGESNYNNLLFDISIDIYPSNGLHKAYCGDIDIVNAETPNAIKCTSGKVKCLIQSLEGTKEIITLELSGAVFMYENKKIELSETLFKNVLISEWGG